MERRGAPASWACRTFVCPSLSPQFVPSWGGGGEGEMGRVPRGMEHHNGISGTMAAFQVAVRGPHLVIQRCIFYPSLRRRMAYILQVWLFRKIVLNLHKICLFKMHNYIHRIFLSLIYFLLCFVLFKKILIKTY